MFRHLYNTEFVYAIIKDKNRAIDGIDLRYRFGVNNRIDEWFVIDSFQTKPCSVLEMIIGLSLRCEETIMMEDSEISKIYKWFWDMIRNLGLYIMDDINYNDRYVQDVLTRFINREYERNGSGGLFTLVNTNRDLRKVEIWYQLCWYLDTILP